MTRIFLRSVVAIAISSTLCSVARAETTTDTGAAKDKKTEVISVIGSRMAYANNSTDDTIKSYSPALSSVNDLVDMLPGVNVREGGAFGSDDWSTDITMRGFSMASGQLGVTIDGVPNGGSGYGGGAKANRYLMAEDTARVEVSQGTSDISSASVDSLGGTFNYISSDPNDEQGATIGITGGDYHARRYYLRYDTGLFWNNTTRSYFSISDTNTDRSLGHSNLDGADGFSASYKLVAELSWATITGRITYDDVDETNYQGISIAQFDENPDWDRLTTDWTGDPVIDQNYAEVWRTLRTNTLAYVRFDIVPSATTKLTVTPYYHHMKGRGDWAPPYQVTQMDIGGTITDVPYYYTDASGTPIPVDGQGNSLTDAATCAALTGADCTRASSYRHTHYGKDRYGMTTNLDWDVTDNNTITVGFWAERQDRDEYRDWHAIIDPSAGPAFNHHAYWRQYDRTYNTDTFKYYFQDKLRLGDWTFTAGARQFLVDITRHDNFLGSDTGDLSSDSDLLPMLGFVWNITNEWELYGGYAENFRAITDDILETDFDYDTIDPETAKNIDVGVRYLSPDLQLTAALYHIKFDNRITKIEQSAGTGGIDYMHELDGTYYNVGGITSKGAEVGADWQLDKHWDLYTALTFNDSTYADDSVFPITDANGDRTMQPIGDNEVAGSPRKMAVLALNYQQAGYSGGLSTKYTGDYKGDSRNEDTLDSHTITDLYFGYHYDFTGNGINSVDLKLNISNLGDVDYLAGGSDGTYYIGTGRTTTATVTVNF